MSGEEIERMKRKNLLQSYYTQSSAGLSVVSDATSLKAQTNTPSSSSSTLSNGMTNSSFNSSDYTGVNSAPSHQIQIHVKDPYDLNSTVFEPDMFLKRLIKVRMFVSFIHLKFWVYF